LLNLFIFLINRSDIRTNAKGIRVNAGMRSIGIVKKQGDRVGMDCAMYRARTTKEEKTMKDRTYTKSLTYIGAGAGVVLFAVFGLLPGSFLGGVMGLNLAGSIFGTPVAAGIAARLIVAASMVLGVMVAGIMFITAASTLGWLIGTAVDALRAKSSSLEEAKHKA
jgi:hypothetical protein